MLTASPATIALLLNAPRVLAADLFTIVLPDTTTLRWSSGDRPFTIGANTFALGPLIARSKTKRKVGVDADTIIVTINDDGNYMFKGRPLLRCLQEGEFDGALVQVDRLFLTDWNDVSPGPVPWFFGYVSESDGSQGQYQLTVKSMMGYLDVPMPKAVYMPSCNNTFGDAACGKDKTALTETGTVGTGATTMSIPLSGFTHGGTTDYFTLGVIAFTSGPNNGLTRTIRSHAGGAAILSPALNVAPTVGDSIKCYPSCNKTDAACIGWSNLPKNRGFPYVPSPQTMYAGSNAPPAPANGQGGDGNAPVGSSGGARRNQNAYTA